MLALENGQGLPSRGTMLYATEQGTVFYFTDQGLTKRFVSAARPGYDIRALPTVAAGIYTGQYYAVGGKLVSLEVDHISPLNQAGAFVSTPARNWIKPIVRYNPYEQGEVPIDFKYQDGQLQYNYDHLPRYHVIDGVMHEIPKGYTVEQYLAELEAKKQRQMIITLIGVMLIIFLVTRK